MSISFQMYQEYEKLAIAVANNDLEAIRKMHAEGVNINLRCIPLLRGMTPLMFAAAQGRHELLRTLLELGADTEEFEYYHGNTAILFAADAGDIEAYEILRDAGADIEVQNRYSIDIGDICDYMLNFNETLKQESEKFRNTSTDEIGETLGDPQPIPEEELEKWKKLKEIYIRDIVQKQDADMEMER